MRSRAFGRFGGLAISLCLMLTGCDGIDGKEADANEGKDPPPDLSDVTGTWKTDCLVIERLGAKAVTRTAVFTAEGDYRRQDVFFEDAACQITSVYFEETGAFKTVNAELLVTVGHQSLLVATATAALALDQLNFCGQDVWTLKGLTDVTGLGCTNYPTNEHGEFLEYFARGDTMMLLGNWWRADAVLVGLGDPHLLDQTTPYRKVDSLTVTTTRHDLTFYGSGKGCDGQISLVVDFSGELLVNQAICRQAAFEHFKGPITMLGSVKVDDVCQLLEPEPFLNQCLTVVEQLK